MKTRDDLDGCFRRVFPLSQDVDSLLYGDPAWDSLKLIELVSEVELVFDTSFDVSELESLVSIQEFEKILRAKGLI
jgi:acyl carrier protein